MCTSDFASRNPTRCKDSRCQICSFAHELQDMGDNTLEIRNLTIQDIKSGTSIMPFTQKKTWKNIQSKDPIHCKLLNLIKTRQLPEVKKTKGDNTKIKLLHNLYTQGKLIVENGLVMVNAPMGNFNGNAISIPPSIFPGIANALHLRLDHPSKAQLSGLIARYFYTPGWRNVINTVSDSCPQCASVKRLPKVLLEDTSSKPASIGSSFAADIIEREGQKIMVIRECTSQYTRAMLIQDQKADTLRNAIITMVLDLIPDSGATIRVDGATSFQQLARESITNASTLKKLGITIVVGRLLNKNKNPVAENTVQEIHKEILRLKNSPGAITPTDLAIVLKNVNSRIRYNSRTPKEVLFRRSTLSNEPLDIIDEDIAHSQVCQRTISSKSSQKHKSKSKTRSPEQFFQKGDLVMLRDVHSKTNPRETYIVDDTPKEKSSRFLLIRKLKEQIRPRLYQALPEELIRSPISQPELFPRKQNSRKPRKAAIKARKKFQDIMSVYPKIHLPKPPKFKHGWTEQDQDDLLEVPLYPHLYNDNLEDSNIVSESDIPTSSNSSTLETVHGLIDSTDADTSEEELAWDNSPEQFTLQKIPTTIVTPSPTAAALPPPFTRTRIPAFSQRPLARQPAFRHKSRRNPDPDTPQSCSRIDAPAAPVKASRIPKPTSPSQLVMNQVNDISLLVPVPTFNTRRSSRLSQKNVQFQQPPQAKPMDKLTPEDKKDETRYYNGEEEDGERDKKRKLPRKH